MKKMTKIATFMTVAAVLLCGCSNSQSSASGENTTYNVPEFSAAGTVEDDRANVYLIVKGIYKDYFKVMFDAAEDAAKDLGCNVYYSGSEESSEWEAQADLMDIAAANGADAVVIAPDDSTRLAGKVSELYNKGVAVICVDAMINTDDYNVCYMTDNLSAGAQAAEEMLSYLKNSGLSEDENASIAIQIGRTSSQTVNERMAGFCQYWAEYAPAKWKVIEDIKSNNGDNSKAVAVAEEYFAEYDNIKGVFGTNDGATRGFASYIAQNNRTDVAIVGFDYSDEIGALINDSSYMASTMLQRQYDMAYNGIKTAVEIKNGTFSTESKLIDTGVIAVNNSNIDDPEVKLAVERN